MSQGTNIPDLHAHVPRPNRVLVQAWIDPDVFKYFFRQLLAGERGPRQSLIVYFFQRYYEACVEAGIKPVWDEENEEKLLAILQRLNFNEVSAPKVRKKVNQKDYH